jgi:hypothetical protein
MGRLALRLLEEDKQQTECSTMSQFQVSRSSADRNAGTAPIRIVPKTNARLARSGAALPLILDIDGTLIRGNLLLASLAALLRRNPVMIFPLLFWFVQGMATFKRRVAERCHLNISRLPANEALVAYARAEKARGRTIVLATAADEIMARRIALRFGFIDRVIASDGKVHLEGAAKARQLHALFPQGFHYASNSHAALSVWQAAEHVIVVEADAGLPHGLAA